MNREMTVREIEEGVREALVPFRDAVTSEEFARARKALSDWVDANAGNRSLYDLGYVPEMAHSLRLKEDYAKHTEENAARLGLTESEIVERRRIDKIVGDASVAETQEKLDAARALMDDWLRRFPTDVAASSWRTGLVTQQMFFDIGRQIEAEEKEAEEAKRALRIPSEKSLSPV